jgi:hypothetical protein
MLRQPTITMPCLTRKKRFLADTSISSSCMLIPAAFARKELLRCLKMHDSQVRYSVAPLLLFQRFALCTSSISQLA